MSKIRMWVSECVYIYMSVWCAPVCVRVVRGACVRVRMVVVVVRACVRTGSAHVCVRVVRACVVRVQVRAYRIRARVRNVLQCGTHARTHAERHEYATTFTRNNNNINSAHTRSVPNA